MADNKRKTVQWHVDYHLEFIAHKKAIKRRRYMSKEEQEQWFQQEAANQRTFEEINSIVGQLMGEIENISLKEEVQEENIPSVSQLTPTFQSLNIPENQMDQPENNMDPQNQN